MERILRPRNQERYRTKRRPVDAPPSFSEHLESDHRRDTTKPFDLRAAIAVAKASAAPQQASGAGQITVYLTNLRTTQTLFTAVILDWSIWNTDASSRRRQSLPKLLDAFQHLRVPGSTPKRQMRR
jgi:hypothetical protein